MLPSHRTLQLFQIFPLKRSVLKYIGGHDHVAGACFEKITRIVRCDPSSDLQAPGIFPQRGKCLPPVCLIVGGILTIQKDHVPAREPVLSVQLRIISRVQLRSKIGLCLVSLILEASSYDLFYFSVMYINTRSEPHFSAPVPLCLTAPFTWNSLYSDRRLQI